jgi:hypothetical protein
MRRRFKRVVIACDAREHGPPLKEGYYDYGQGSVKVPS